MTDVLVDKPVAGVVLITLNRPDSLNAMGGTLLSDLADALAEAEHDRNVRCVALTGAGKGFCSGGDVKGMAGQRPASGDGDAPREAPSPAVALERSAARLYDSVSKTSLKLHTMLKPTVALVNGAAAGAGLSLALSCDIRLCSDRAKFVPAFGRIAFSGDYGGSYYLTKLVGYGRAREIYFTGMTIDAQRALELGIANHVIAGDELLERGVEYCAKLAAGAPGTIARMKENFLRAEWAPIEQSLREEAFNHALSGTTHDHAEGVRAFMEKRDPTFSGD